MEKPVARLTKIKRVKTRSTDTRNRIESVAADPPTIGKTANEHYELCYACKFENLKETHDFLENNEPPKHRQEKIDNLNILITIKKAEFPKFSGILSAALSQHHLLGFEITQLEFHHLY